MSRPPITPLTEVGKVARPSQKHGNMSLNLAKIVSPCKTKRTPSVFNKLCRTRSPYQLPTNGDAEGGSSKALTSPLECHGGDVLYESHCTRAVSYGEAGGLLETCLSQQETGVEDRDFTSVDAREETRYGLCSHTQAHHHAILSASSCLQRRLISIVRPVRVPVEAPDGFMIAYAAPIILQPQTSIYSYYCEGGEIEQRRLGLAVFQPLRRIAASGKPEASGESAGRSPPTSP